MFAAVLYLMFANGQSVKTMAPIDPQPTHAACVKQVVPHVTKLVQSGNYYLVAYACEAMPFDGNPA